MTLEATLIDETGSTLSHTYKMDVVGKQEKRMIWIHRNQQEDRPLAYVQPIIPICAGDSALISVPLFNQRGNFLDFTSNSKVIFQKAKFTKIRDSYEEFKETKYVKLDMVDLVKNELAKTWDYYWQSYYRHDLNRICEVEEYINEWFDITNCETRLQTLKTYGYEDIIELEPELQLISAGFEKSCLSLVKMEIGGTDIRILKLELLATAPGQEFFSVFDSNIKVVPKEAACLNEVKRSGLIMDLSLSPFLSLRIGDKLVIYIN